MLTLHEIENISFREVPRFSIAKGYICSDVDNFADEVTETVKGLEKKIAELEEQLRVHEEKADSVQNAIITAEMAAKKLMKDASSKAEKIMSEAVERSNRIVEESQKTADKNLYEAGEKARLILDNALSSSAQCVEENNRIIEDQKVYISVLQDESVKFREKLLDMYKKQVKFTENLPCGEECRKYQESMNENYPTEKPLTADTVVEKIKKDADTAKIHKKSGKRLITVETSDGKKEEIAEDEIVFNSIGASQKFDGLKINYINEKG